MITTCKEGDNSWWIEASTLDIDQQEETADGRNARLSISAAFQFLPHLTLLSRLARKRKSGFLTPKMGANSTFGFNVEIPYYWNIAPNYDYTMVLKADVKTRLYARQPIPVSCSRPSAVSLIMIFCSMTEKPKRRDILLLGNTLSVCGAV